MFKLKYLSSIALLLITLSISAMEDSNDHAESENNNDSYCNQKLFKFEIVRGTFGEHSQVES